MKFSAETTWDVDPELAIATLNEQMRNKCQRIALNAAASGVKSAMIEAMPSDTGTMKKSVRIKIVNYKAKNLWFVLVGPSHKYVKAIKEKMKRAKRKKTRVGRFLQNAAKYVRKKTLGKKKPKIKRIVRPAAYYPLVNDGTVKAPAQHIDEKTKGTAFANFAQVYLSRFGAEVQSIISKRGGKS